MTDTPKDSFDEWLAFRAQRAGLESIPWADEHHARAAWNHLMAIIETRNEQLAVYTFRDPNGEAVPADWQQEHIDTLLERIATLEAQLKEAELRIKGHEQMEFSRVMADFNIIESEHHKYKRGE